MYTYVSNVHNMLWPKKSQIAAIVIQQNKIGKSLVGSKFSKAVLNVFHSNTQRQSKLS
jgi:hypothetical protein